MILRRKLYGLFPVQYYEIILNLLYHKIISVEKIEDI